MTLRPMASLRARARLVCPPAAWRCSLRRSRYRARTPGGSAPLKHAGKPPGVGRTGEINHQFRTTNSPDVGTRGDKFGEAERASVRHARVASEFLSHSFMASCGCDDLASAMTSGWLIAGHAFNAPLPGWPATGFEGLPASTRGQTDRPTQDNSHGHSGRRSSTSGARWRALGPGVHAVPDRRAAAREDRLDQRRLLRGACAGGTGPLSHGGSKWVGRHAERHL